MATARSCSDATMVRSLFVRLSPTPLARRPGRDTPQFEGDVTKNLRWEGLESRTLFTHRTALRMLVLCIL